MNFRRAMRLGAMATSMLGAAAMPPVSTAIELASQSNLVRDDFDASNYLSPLAWNPIPKYQPDTIGDVSPLDGHDWFYTQVAHNSEWFFVRYHNTAPFAGNRQLMYFDVDSNPETGFRGFTGNLAIGAEFHLNGAALNQDGVGFLDWAEWNNVEDADGNWDIVAKVKRSLMPGVENFNFLNQDHDEGGDDWYPDAGNNLSGDWFHYETGAFNSTTAFGREWSIIEPSHRENPSVQAEILGTATTMTFNGVYQTSMDMSAVTPLTPVVGTKVRYDLALTHEERDNDGDGDGGTWTAEALGAFTSSASDPSDHLLVSTRVGARPFDGPATRIIHERSGDADEPEETSVSLAGSPLEQGVQIEWLFTSETTIEISIFSKDGSTLLGPTYTDVISSINDIQGFRLNLFDSEQTMTVSDFTVETVNPTIEGDFNGDGVVDGADLNDPVLGWKARFGVDLDGEDFLAWQRRFGAGASSIAAGAVPEPSAAILALGGLLRAGVARRRTR